MLEQRQLMVIVELLVFATLIFHILSARQKTHFFREPVLPRLVISGLIINTGAIFSCRRIKNDNNFVTIQLILPWPIRLGLMHLHEIRFFALKKQC
ncbi:MAG: hypothetical protein KZQ66_21010 [Candidatus Thiodiazotropha sp. (ex Lucinoma aequizonata)]|nr:hypothetical protein [Candidatus Thiodiazotropha sp. (ex Lucinoma aequizonata)]MCU7904145.1 hypothetical protein [Candidatus Thiodiazotropha sp. (ex Lucinoma aequizonata)]